MLSDLILEHKGKTTSNRILDVDIQKQETTVTARGKVRGSLDVSIVITYWNMPRPIDHDLTSNTARYYYGEGKGIISVIGEYHETATVTEYGVGRLLGQNTVWRGSAFYRTSSSISGAKLSFLDNIVGVFETEVDNVSSDVSEKIWQWK
jgi:hypothetical protein